MALLPVEYNPFDSEVTPVEPKLTPVEHDPFEKESIKLLPDFLTFDSKESQEKRDKLLQEDPEKFMNLMQKSQLEGFNRGIQDIGEGLKQITLEAGEFIGLSDPEITGDYTKKVQEERERYEESYGLFPGSKVTRFIGNSAPYAYLPVKMPSGIFKRIGMGGALGGSIAGTQFVEDGDSRALNVLAGGTVGVAIPAIGKAISGTLKWANQTLREPFTKDGAYNDIAKFLRKEISENREDIISSIEGSISKGENKTIAQILAERTQGTKKDFGGMLVRLEKDLSRESDVLKSLYATQSQARRSVINSVAGTGGDLAKAITLRSNNANINYNQKAFKVAINADSKLVKLSRNKYFNVALSDAKDIAEVKGINSKDNLTEFLHLVKEGLDKQLNATDAMGKTALGREELKAVTSVKDGLVKWMGEKNILYDQARKQFILDSAPVNKMEIGQELKKAFINALDQDRPSMFASAIENAKKTVKKAAGIKGGFEGMLDPKQIRALESLRKGLVIESHRKKMAGESKAVLGALTGETTLALPHILSRPIVITNHILKIIGKDRTPEYRRLLVDIVRDPRKFLEAYRLPESNKKAQMAMDIVRKMNIIAATQGAQGAINE